MIIITNRERKFVDEWHSGIPVQIGCHSLTGLQGINDAAKCDLLQGVILFDPNNFLTEWVSDLRKELLSSGKTIKNLKLCWLSRIGEEQYLQATKSKDPYSTITFLRDSCYYIISHFLLDKLDIWKPRSQDLSLYLSRHMITIEKIMNSSPLLDIGNEIQDKFEILEEQLLSFVELDTNKINPKGQEMVRRSAAVNKSRLLAFYMEKGDWLSSIFGYRNYLNRLYPYPIAEAYGFTPPHFIGELLNINDPPIYPILCREINCFRDPVKEHLEIIQEQMINLKHQLHDSK